MESDQLDFFIGTDLEPAPPAKPPSYAEILVPAPPVERAAPEGGCQHTGTGTDRFGHGRCVACGADFVTAPDGARGPHW